MTVKTPTEANNDKNPNLPLFALILLWAFWVSTRLVPWWSAALCATLFAALLAATVNSAAKLLHRLSGLPKRSCAILLFFALTALLAFGFLTLGGKLIKEAEELILSLSVYRADADALVMRLTLTAADGTPVTLIDYASAGQDDGHNVCAWIKTK